MPSCSQACPLLVCDQQKKGVREAAAGMLCPDPSYKEFQAV